MIDIGGRAERAALDGLGLMPPPTYSPAFPTGGVPRRVEKDPSGLDLKTPGAKADAGKLRPTLVFKDMARALLAVVKIATDGAEKYSAGGWLKVSEASMRYEDADLRHMLKRWIEGPVDADSKSLHLAHEAWNALAKLELHLREQEKNASARTTG